MTKLKSLKCPDCESTDFDLYALVSFSRDTLRVPSKGLETYQGYIISEHINADCNSCSKNFTISKARLTAHVNCDICHVFTKTYLIGIDYICLDCLKKQLNTSCDDIFIQAETAETCDGPNGRGLGFDELCPPCKDESIRNLADSMMDQKKDEKFKEVKL